MKELTKYQCEVCGIAYNTAAEALHCEQKPLPELTAKIQIGDDISYFMEISPEPGAALTYKEVHGKVLDKLIALNERSREHECMLICSSGDCEVPQERGVITVNMPNEGVQFYAPVDYAYKVGFAELIKKSKEQ